MQNNALNFDDRLRSDNPYRAAQGKGFIPPFAFNSEQLQMVLVLRMLRYLHKSPSKFNLAELHQAAKKAVVSSATDPVQRDAQKKHRRAVKKAGGYLELQAAIAYRAWRERLQAHEIAEGLGVTPWMVRQSLRRMRGIAAELGFPVGKRHHTFQSDGHSSENEKEKEQ